ncbi:MAG: transposase [Thermodesulfobacteriota bacterium]
MTEVKARDFLEEIQRPDGPICPHCGSVNESYHLEGGLTRP